MSRISDDWEGLPGNIDTAVTWKDTGATYIFKVGLEKESNNINKKTYYLSHSFFSGQPVLEIQEPNEEGKRGKFPEPKKIFLYMKLSFGQPGYPKQISEGFPGIPGDLDAAILAAANNKMYFFKVQDGNDNVIYIKSVDSGRQLLEI